MPVIKFSFVEIEKEQTCKQTTDVNSLDVNVDVHPQLELLPVLDHKDLEGGLLLTNHLGKHF